MTRGAAVAATVVAAALRPAVASAPAAPPQPSRAAGLQAFEVIRGVLQHPRCRNCHAAGDAPLQGDDSRPHAMNVRRGPDGRGEVGERCPTCHGPANPPDSYGGAQPPGVSTGWRMPAPGDPLVFSDATPPALCQLVRARGRQSPATLRRYLDDPLVTSAWVPGFGRRPIPIPHRDFLAAFDTWTRAGAPCPE